MREIFLRAREEFLKQRRTSDRDLIATLTYQEDFQSNTHKSHTFGRGHSDAK